MVTTTLELPESKERMDRVLKPMFYGSALIGSRASEFAPAPVVWADVAICTKPNSDMHCVPGVCTPMSSRAI